MITQEHLFLYHHALFLSILERVGVGVGYALQTLMTTLLNKAVIIALVGGKQPSYLPRCSEFGLTRYIRFLRVCSGCN